MANFKLLLSRVVRVSASSFPLRGRNDNAQHSRRRHSVALSAQGTRFLTPTLSRSDGHRVPRAARSRTPGDPRDGPRGPDPRRRGRPPAHRRARARKWHACCARTLPARHSAAVCDRDTERQRRTTNPALRTENPTSGPRASALWMSPVCVVVSRRGGGAGARQRSCRRGLLGVSAPGGPGPRGIVEPTIPQQSPATIPRNPY